MSLESWVVAARYDFSGNLQFLQQVAKYADAAAISLDRMAEAAEAANRSVDAFAAAAGRMDASLDTTSKGISGMSRATTRAAGRIDTGANSIAASYDRIAAAAGRADMATAAYGRTAGASAVRASAGGAAGRIGARGVTANAATVGGFGALAILGAGIHGGASMQDAVVQTAIASGMKTDDARRLYTPVAIQMSNLTAQTQAQSMQLLRVMATSGFSDPKELLANNAELPKAIARYADTQYLGRHQVPFEESVSQAVQLAHQLGTRSGPQLTNMLNTLFKISQDMPDSVAQAATQVKYYGPQFTQAGVSASEILSLQATADRLGLGGGRSGTGFRALYASLLNPSTKNYAAEEQLGLLDSSGRNRFLNQRTGAFNVEGFFQSLNDRYNAARKNGTVGDFNSELARLSTSGAGSVLSLFSSNAGREQRAKVSQTLQRVPDIIEAQARLMDTLNNQTKRLGSNFGTLASIISGPLVEPLTNFVKMLGDALETLSNFFANHPQATQVASVGLAGAGAFGAFQLIRMLGGASVFVHALAHDAAGKVGLHGMGGAAMHFGEHGAGMLGRVGGGILDMLSFPGIRGLAGLGGRAAGGLGRKVGLGGVMDAVGEGFGRLAPILGRVGSFVRISGIGFDLLGKVIGSLGARFIPFVGEVLLAIDAIKFLGAHAKDIGWIIGRVARWIKDDGGPMLLKAFVDVVTFIANGIKDTIAGIFNGGHGGLFDFIRNVVQGAQQGYSDGGPQTKIDPKTVRSSPRAEAKQVNGYTHHDHSTNIGTVHVSYNGTDVEPLIASAKRHAQRGDTSSSTHGLTAPATTSTGGTHVGA